MYFNETLLRGNRSTKINSFRLDAFGSPNHPALAEVGVNISPRYDLTLEPPRSAFRVHKRYVEVYVWRGGIKSLLCVDERLGPNNILTPSRPTRCNIPTSISNATPPSQPS